MVEVADVDVDVDVDADGYFASERVQNCEDILE